MKLKIYQSLARAFEPSDRKSMRVESPRERSALWFHAASAGELEILIPIIEGLGTETPLILTVFSESGEKSLEGLGGRLREQGRNILYSGLSPFEGSWRPNLAKLRPSAFVTARYEAWPELWASLAFEDIPLVIVGARDRSSLRWGRKFSKLLSGKLPKLYWCVDRESDAESIRSANWEGQRVTTGDPRWDRILRRSQGVHPRVKELVEQAKELPRPWGILGSAWKEDFKELEGALKSFDGTLWVVPHHIKGDEYLSIKGYLERSFNSVVETSSGQPGASGSPMLVNEMGFLAELYGAMDWAYVGGGFGESIHNTMEPAAFGLPVACGPRGVKRFGEIKELQSSGQLTIVSSASDLEAWLQGLKDVQDEQRARWKEECSKNGGASMRVVDLLTSLIESDA